MRAYQLEVVLSKQEDGLWRAEVPALQGCFADNATLHGAIQDIQEVAALLLDLQNERGEMSNNTAIDAGGTMRATLPVIIEDHIFRGLKRKRVPTV